MAIIKPFNGVRYDQKKAGPIKELIAPPYDVISPKMQRALYRANLHNIVRLELGVEKRGDTAASNKYTRAADIFRSWIDSGILSRDEQAGIYVYAQDYIDGTVKRRRVGFFAQMKLESPDKKKVLPHENTFKAPKEDRFRLITRVGANLSPIFSLYQDPGRRVAKILLQAARRSPTFDLKSDGIRHRLWHLTDAAALQRIVTSMRPKTVFIADGHHRYEVALRYRAYMREKNGGKGGPYDYVMMYFSDMDPRGLTVHATHRLIQSAGRLDEAAVIRRIKDGFLVKRIGSSRDLLSWLDRSKDLAAHFGLYLCGHAYSLKLKDPRSLDIPELKDRSSSWKRLDVSVLHQYLLKRLLRISDAEGAVAYTRDPLEAVREVDAGRSALAFLLNPTKVREVRTIAMKGERMPHKSTYFYPKLLTGLVINKLG